MPKDLALFLLVCLAGCSSADSDESNIELPHRSEAIAQDLNNYARSVSSATDGSISAIGLPKRTGDVPTLSYVFEFKTSNAALMAKDDADTNKLSLAHNTALAQGWSRRFCTPRLKSIMATHEIFMVSGHLVDASGRLQTFSSCMRA